MAGVAKYSLEIKPAAAKELDALENALFARIDRKILVLAFSVPQRLQFRPPRNFLSKVCWRDESRINDELSQVAAQFNGTAISFMQPHLSDLVPAERHRMPKESLGDTVLIGGHIAGPEPQSENPERQEKHFHYPAAPSQIITEIGRAEAEGECGASIGDYA
jgi:hypothetical protein